MDSKVSESTADRRSRRRREVAARQAAGLARFVEDGAAWVLCPLCLTAYMKSNLDSLTLEHAPPKQFKGLERCFTCDCNHLAGQTFENQTGMILKHRREAIAAATSSTPLYPSRPTAKRLATVQGAEKLTELKSAYLLAFVTLGFRYVLGWGLDQVRAAIREEDATDCCVRTELPGEDDIYLVRHPLECLLVRHPSPHAGDFKKGHAVVLPLPSSAANFYDTTGRLVGRPRIGVEASYKFPEVRRVKFLWDKSPVRGTPTRRQIRTSDHARLLVEMR